MKKYTIFGPTGLTNATGFQTATYEYGPIFSGTILSGGSGITGSSNVITGPWIPTHFGFDEVAEIGQWCFETSGMVGPAGCTCLLWFEQTWNPTYTLTSDTRIERMSMIHDNGGALYPSWAGSLPVYIQGASSGTASLNGLFARGIISATSASVTYSTPLAPLAPYIRPVLYLHNLSAGTMQLYIGLYGYK